VRCLREAALCICSPHGAVSLDNTLSIVKWLDLLPQWLARRPRPDRVIRSGPRQAPGHRAAALA
jgi:hypothetical protein